MAKHRRLGRATRADRIDRLLFELTSERESGCLYRHFDSQLRERDDERPWGEVPESCPHCGAEIVIVRYYVAKPSAQHEALAFSQPEKAGRRIV